MDSLDPSAGLVHKFLAIQELLTKIPELSQELVFVQIMLPTGSNCPNAERVALEAQIDAIVSRINSTVRQVFLLCASYGVVC